MLQSIIFGLAIFFSVYEVIYLINNIKTKAPILLSFIMLLIPCALWAYFYYLTH